MSIASLEAGLAFSHTATTAPHSVSYPMTAHFNLSHGFACALTLPEFLLYNYNLNKEDYAATLAQLARGMKELRTDVVEKNGQLEFQYVSGLENLTPEQAARVQRFNEVASELSKLPMEWTADDSKKGFFRQMMDKAGLGQGWSPDDPTRSQHRRTGELNAEFQSLKQEVVRIIKRQKDSDLKKAGVEKFDDLETQSHATAQMLQIENLLRCNRAMNVNPDAEKALLEKIVSNIVDENQRIPVQKIYRSKGCPRCNNTGFKGRIGVFEAILIDGAIEEIILFILSLLRAKPKGVPYDTIFIPWLLTLSIIHGFFMGLSCNKN